jgi:hypothetical protein
VRNSERRNRQKREGEKEIYRTKLNNREIEERVKEEPQLRKTVRGRETDRQTDRGKRQTDIQRKETDRHTKERDRQKKETDLEQERERESSRVREKETD